MFERIKIFCSIVLCTLITGVLLSACDDEDSVKTPTQFFRPIDFKVSAIDGSEPSVILSWSAIKGATYKLEYARNEGFTEGLQSIELETPVCVLSDLWSEVEYWARVKSVSNNPEIQDSDWRFLTFTAPIENIFTSIVAGIDNVSLGWDATKTVTRIVVSTLNTSDRDISLSSEEIATGKTNITDLNPDTSYEFKIFNGEIIRGTLTENTLVANIFSKVSDDDIGLNSVLLKWDNAKIVSSLTVSTEDETVDVIMLSPAEIAAGEKQVEGLLPETDYEFKLSNGIALWGTLSVRTSLLPGNILNMPVGDDIGSDFITLKWNNEAKAITHIIVSVLGVDDTKIEISEDDIEVYQKKVENLSADTDYEFRIYNGDMLRGTVSAKTDIDPTP